MTRRTLLALSLAIPALVLSSSRFATAAGKTEPLEVTYYYMPG